MKHLALLVIILMAVNAKGQIMDSTINKLIEQELILKEQEKELENLVNNSYSKGTISYLMALLQLEQKKLTGQADVPVLMNFALKKPDEKRQKEINIYLINYLTKLKLCRLVNDRQFIKISKQINDNSFVHPLHLLYDVINQVQADEHMSPEKLRLFSDKLLEHSICTGDNVVQLNQDIEDYKLNHQIDFLKYCDKSTLIELANYSEELNDYLEKIHKETASLVEGLEFEEFNYEVVLDSQISDEKFKSYKLIISLKCNGKTYKQKSFYSPLEKRTEREGMSYFGKIGSQDYYNIFNKILADNQSPYRLHLVKSVIKNVADYSKFGIIALTEKQAEILHGGGTYISPSYENFKNNLTSNSIENAITEYEKIGLFRHLSEEEINQGKSKVQERENRNLNHILMSFPNVIHSFDLELGNLENPYFELVNEYSNISHGEFNPTNVSDDFDIQSRENCTLSFDLNEKTYSKKLIIEDDWIDGTFFEFIDNVVSENDLKGKFYQLYQGGQGANIIYLNLEQYTYLRENKLVVFEDEWRSQE